MQGSLNGSFGQTGQPTHAGPFEPPIKSHFYMVLFTFGEKCNPKGSKNDPLEGPGVVKKNDESLTSEGERREEIRLEGSWQARCFSEC